MLFVGILFGVWACFRCYFRSTRSANVPIQFFMHSIISIGFYFLSFVVLSLKSVTKVDSLPCLGIQLFSWDGSKLFTALNPTQCPQILPFSQRQDLFPYFATQLLLSSEGCSTKFQEVALLLVSSNQFCRSVEGPSWLSSPSTSSRSSLPRLKPTHASPTPLFLSFLFPASTGFTLVVLQFTIIINACILPA